MPEEDLETLASNFLPLDYSFKMEEEDLQQRHNLSKKKQAAFLRREATRKFKASVIQIVLRRRQNQTNRDIRLHLLHLQRKAREAKAIEKFKNKEAMKVEALKQENE